MPQSQPNPNPIAGQTRCPAKSFHSLAPRTSCRAESDEPSPVQQKQPITTKDKLKQNPHKHIDELIQDTQMFSACGVAQHFWHLCVPFWSLPTGSLILLPACLLEGLQLCTLPVQGISEGSNLSCMPCNQWAAVKISRYGDHGFPVKAPEWMTCRHKQVDSTTIINHI